MAEDIFADIREAYAPPPPVEEPPPEEKEEDIFADIREAYAPAPQRAAPAAPRSAPPRRGGGYNPAAGGKVGPDQIYGYLLDRGVSPEHAVGMINNIQHESGFDAGINEKAPLVKGSRGGFGLFQHTGPRRRQLEAFAQQMGRPVSDWQTQLEFALQEEDTQKYLSKQFRSPAEASYAFTTEWERPQHKEQKGRQRLASLGNYTDLIGTGGTPTRGYDPTSGGVADLPYEPGAPIPDLGGQEEGPSAEDMESAFEDLFAGYEPPEPAAAPVSDQGDIAAGFTETLPQAQMLGYGAAAVAGEALDWDWLKDWGMEGYQEKSAELEARSEGRTRQLEDIEGVGDFVDYAQYMVGQGLGSFAEYGAAALAGSLVGSAVPVGGTAAGAVAGAAGKTALKGLLNKRIKAMAEKGIKKGMGKSAALDAARKGMVKKIGAAASVLGYGYVQGVGDIGGEFINEDGTIDENAAITAFSAAVPYALLDKFTEAGFFKKIIKPSEAESIAKRALAEGAKAAGSEAITEALQDVAIKMGAATLAGQEYTGAEYLSALANSMAGGALMGAPMGAAQAIPRTEKQVEEAGRQERLQRWEGQKEQRREEALQGRSETFSQKIDTIPETRADEAAAVRAVQDDRKLGGMVLREESAQAARDAGLEVIETENGYLITKPENVEAATNAEAAGERYRVLGYVEDKAEALQDPDAVVVRPVDSSGASPGAQLVSQQNLEAAQTAAQAQAGEGGTVETISIEEEYQRRQADMEAEQEEQKMWGEQEARTQEEKMWRERQEQEEAAQREWAQAEPPATEAAKKRAKAAGIDLRDIPVTGKGGQITVGDVQKAIVEKRATKAPEKATVTNIEDAKEKRQYEEDVKAQKAAEAKPTGETTPKEFTTAAERLAASLEKKKEKLSEEKELRLDEGEVAKQASEVVKARPKRKMLFRQEGIDYVLATIDTRRQFDVEDEKTKKGKPRLFTTPQLAQEVRSMAGSKEVPGPLEQAREALKKSAIGKQKHVIALQLQASSLIKRVKRVGPKAVRGRLDTLVDDIRAWMDEVDKLEIHKSSPDIEEALAPEPDRKKKKKKKKRTPKQRVEDAKTWDALIRSYEPGRVPQKQILAAIKAGISPQDFLDAEMAFAIESGTTAAVQEGTVSTSEENQPAKTADVEAAREAREATARGKKKISAATPETKKKAAKERRDDELARLIAEQQSEVEQEKAGAKAAADIAEKQKKAKEVGAKVKVVTKGAGRRGKRRFTLTPEQRREQLEELRAKRESRQGPEEVDLNRDDINEGDFDFNEDDDGDYNPLWRPDRIKRRKREYDSELNAIPKSSPRRAIMEAREEAMGVVLTLKEDMDADIETVLEALQQELHPDDPYRFVVDAIASVGMSNVLFDVMSDSEVRAVMEDDWAVAGFLAADNAQLIVLADSVADSAQGLKSFLHEMVHASLNESMRTDNKLALEMERLRQLAEDKLGVYDPESTPELYGLYDVHEFMAEALTNEDFQQRLAGISTGERRSLWDEIVQAIRNFFNMPVEADSVLAHVLSAAPELMISSERSMQVLSDRQAAPYIETKFDEKELFDSIMMSDRKVRRADVASRLVGTGKSWWEGLRENEKVENTINFVQQGLPVLSTSQIERMYRGKLDGLNDYKRVDDTRQRIANTWQLKAQEISRKWNDNARQDQNGDKRLKDLMIDTTRAAIDPTRPISDYPPSKHAQYTTFKQRYNALPPWAKEVYTGTRDYYTEQRKAQRKSLFGKLMKFELGGRAIPSHVQQAMSTARDIKAMRSAMAPIRKPLEKEAQKLKNIPFKKRTDAQKSRLDELQEQLKEIASVEKAAAKVAKLTMVDPPYFPQRRYGKYVIHGVMKSDPDQPFAEFYDTEIEANKALRRLSGKVNFKDGVSLKRNLAKPHTSMMPSSYAILTNKLDPSIQQQVDAAIVDILADNAMRESNLHRENVEGDKLGENMHRAFAERAYAGAWSLADMDTAFERSEALKKMENSAQGAPDLGRVVHELQTREKNTVLDRVTYDTDRFFGKLGFLGFLGQVSYSLVNATQVAIVGYPYLSSKYKLRDVNREIGKAYKTNYRAALKAVKDYYTDLENLKAWKAQPPPETIWEDMMAAIKADDPDAARAINDLQERRIIDATFAMELYQQMKSVDPGVMDSFVNFARAAPQAAETLNRVVMAQATYRLARQKGRDHEGAVDDAYDAIDATQFNPMEANKPRWLKWNVPGWRAIMMFKTHVQGMYALMIPATIRAVKGEKEAQKLMLGLIAAHSLLAGAAGGLMMEPVRMLIDLTGLMFGWDDEDVEEELEKLLAGWSNETIAEGLMHGAPRWLDLDLQGRIGLDSMLFRQVGGGKVGAEKAQTQMAQLFGPMGSVYANAMEAAQVDFPKGEYAKGLQKLLPAQFRAFVATAEQQLEGVSSKAGETFIQPEEFGFVEGMYQMLGFTPGVKSAGWERRIRTLRAKYEGKDAADVIKHRFKRASPAERIKILREEVPKHNRKYRGNTDAIIKPENLWKGLTERREREQQIKQTGLRYYVNPEDRGFYD